MKYLIACIIFALLLFMQIQYNIPLLVSGIIFFAVLFQEYGIFLLTFCFGVLLDVFSFAPLGASSLFFTVMLFLLFLYGRKYEVASMPFVVVFSFLANVLYGMLFSAPWPFVSAIFVTALLALCFFCFEKIVKA